MDFEQYIYQTQKTYKFKIGIAADYTDDDDDDLETKLENALKKYGVISFSAPKTTPILARPLDFPLLSNTSATYWEVELHYPTYEEALRTYISQACQLPVNRVVARTPDSPIEAYQNTDGAETPYTTLLTQPDSGGESAQHLVGQNRVMELLKELEKAKKEEQT